MTATLSAAQLAWYVTGGTAQHDGTYGTNMPITAHNAVIAVAVALAESGGQIKRSDNPNKDGSYDWGPWQINDKAHAVSDTAKTNVGANWALAYQISDRGTNWTPWTTYKQGKYLAFMAQAQAGVNNPDGSYQDQKEIPNTPGSAAASIASDLLPDSWKQAATWIRVGEAVAGVILLGLVIVSIVGAQRIAGMVPATRMLEAVGNGVRSAHHATKSAVKDSVRTVAGK